MAITGVSSISGQQIIAAGALSARSASTALYDENGTPITSYLTAVPEGYATTAEVANKLDASAVNTAFIPLQGFGVSGIDNKPIFAQTATSANYAKFDINGTYLTSYLTAVPTGTMNETAFAYDSDDLIIRYNGSAFAATLPASADVMLDRVYRNGDIWDTVTGKQDITGMTAYLTAVPDTYLQNTDLSTEDGKVTAISGIPLSGGGEVPEGVMVESGLEYNAVQEISGYNGSAIAQYGAEKQFLTHDDTIVHLSNSAQYALGVNVPVVSQQMGVDETILWTNADPQMMKYQAVLSGTLSEPCSAFNMLRFICKGSYDYGENFSAAVEHQDFYTNDSTSTNSVGVILFNRKGNTIYRDTCQIDFNGNTFTAHDGSRIQGLTALSENLDRGPYIMKVIGIGRKN